MVRDPVTAPSAGSRTEPFPQPLPTIPALEHRCQLLHTQEAWWWRHG